MKQDRQEMIRKIIGDHPIETQEELARRLLTLGFRVTQATVSRDIREMRLVKVRGEGGGYHYAVPKRPETAVSGRMIRILSDTLLSVDHAGNMVVAKTLSGSANVAGEVLDTVDWPEILGTIAGDNTIMILVRTEADAAEIAMRIQLLVGAENGKAQGKAKGKDE